MLNLFFILFFFQKISVNIVFITKCTFEIIKLVKELKSPYLLKNNKKLSQTPGWDTLNLI